MIAVAALALAGTTLGGCADGRYGYGVGVHWVSHPYDVWYDGYYGPFYDGYWGIDGIFYFRIDARDRAYRRGDPRHFRKELQRGEPRFRRYEGVTREPPRGTRMPSYPPHQKDRSRDRDRDRY